MFDKETPETKWHKSIASTKSLQHQVAVTPCPACGQQTLKLSTYTKSKQEWGAAVTCTNCNFSGEVNSTGFTYNRVDSKGKAKE